MKNKALLILSILMAICLFTSGAAAQSGGSPTITQSVVASGGGSSSGGGFSMTGTIGQSAAGTTSSNGAYSIAGGFWSAAPAGLIVISGTVTLNGSPLQGVTVTLSGSADETDTTDVNGNYEFTNLFSGGTYTVSPSLTGHIFDPPSTTLISATSDQTADFAACTASLTPNNFANVGAAATAGSFMVNISGGCSWTALTNYDWLSLTPPASGTGNGTINYSVGANSGSQRVGTITVAGQTFTVTQAVGHSIGGTITYGTNNSKVVPGATLTAPGTPTIMTTTSLSGAYLLEGLTNGVGYTVTPSKIGDANNISAGDATLVLRCVALTTGCTLTANQRTAGDANGDGKLSAVDATMILRYAAARRATADTGGAGNWIFSPESVSYPPLNGNLTGKNYTGFLIGDVNGNWEPPTLLTAPEAIEWQEPDAENFNQPAEQKDASKTEATVQISLPTNLTAAKGSTVLIPVLLSNKSDKAIFAYGFDVTFDPAVLQIDSDNPIETTGTLTKSSRFSVATDTKIPGRIGIAAAGGKFEANAAGTLVNLRLKVVGEPHTSRKRATLAITHKAFEDLDGIIPATASSSRQFIVAAETSKAATVGVGGRVLDKDGQGIKNVLVRLVDAKGIEKTVLTSDFGYYRFSEVQADQSYTVSVSTKKYKFTQSSHEHLVSAETNEINFVAEN